MQIWTGTPTQWQQQWLQTDLQRPRYVITATNRLALRLRHDLQASLQLTGKTLTPAPQILDYHSWLQNLWSVLCWQSPQPLRLLSDLQVQHVWRRVLLASELDVLNTAAVIELSIQAYQSLRAYRVQDSEWHAFASGDVRWFSQAYRQYQSQLHQHHYLDPADLANALIAADISTYLTDVDIDWVGFIEQTPEQLFLIQTLSGAQHRQINWQASNVSVARVTCKDAIDEFQQALAWAQKIAQTAATAQIAIVVPDLQKNRAQWQREILRLQSSIEINLSGGEPLAQLPVFKTLYSALCLLETPWQLKDVLHLCRSNFIGDALILPEALHSQLPLTAQPEIFQRSLQAQGLTPAWLMHLTQKMTEVIAPRTLSQWCDFAKKILLQLNWPGSSSLNSVDYQAIQKIEQLWWVISDADVMDEVWPFADFLALLQQQAQQQLFQPESPETQIQVLGLWEATGQSFDALWITGLHQDAWPRSTKLSPFLPRDVQIARQLPRACPQQEWQLATQLLQHWQQASSQVIFSFAEQDGAAHQAASPLIALFPEASDGRVQRPVAAVFNLENYTENYIAVTDDEKPRGGSAILASQALCAFQAFARFRLRVKTVEETVLGFSAQQRGILVHSCLEIFWRQHQHQDNLKALTSEALQQQLQCIIESQLQTQSLIQSSALNAALIQAEQQRLLKLLTQWLEMEKQRTPFKVIALEQALDVQLSNLNLSIRLDRIDQLQSGESILIDYKTGAVNLQDWWHQPCLAPQLPLYALTVSPRADAIVYGVVCLPKPMLKGLGSAALRIYDDAPRHLQQAVDALEDWSDLQTRWQQDIQKLADDFCRGVANLQPINGDATCSRCGLQSLCRIDSVANG
jgi:hypothetical protein